MPHFRRILLFLLPLFLGSLAVQQANPASPTIIDRTGGRLMPSGPASFGGPLETWSQAVPTSPTDITGSTAHILGLWVHNPVGGSSITLTFKDKQGTPQPLPLDGQVITAGSDVVFNAPFGILAQGGMTISASGAGLSYEVVFTH